MSSNKFATDIKRMSIANLLHNHGLDKTTLTATDVLVDLLGRYMELIARKTMDMASGACQRTDVNLCDLSKGLEMAGVDVFELKLYFEDWMHHRTKQIKVMGGLTATEAPTDIIMSPTQANINASSTVTTTFPLWVDNTLPPHVLNAQGIDPIMAFPRMEPASFPIDPFVLDAVTVDNSVVNADLASQQDKVLDSDNKEPLLLPRMPTEHDLMAAVRLEAEVPSWDDAEQRLLDLSVDYMDDNLLGSSSNPYYTLVPFYSSQIAKTRKASDSFYYESSSIKNSGIHSAKCDSILPTDVDAHRSLMTYETQTQLSIRESTELLLDVLDALKSNPKQHIPVISNADMVSLMSCREAVGVSMNREAMFSGERSIMDDLFVKLLPNMDNVFGCEVRQSESIAHTKDMLEILTRPAVDMDVEMSIGKPIIPGSKISQKVKQKQALINSMNAANSGVILTPAIPKTADKQGKAKASKSTVSKSSAKKSFGRSSSLTFIGNGKNNSNFNTFSDSESLYDMSYDNSRPSTPSGFAFQSKPVHMSPPPFHGQTPTPSGASPPPSKFKLKLSLGSTSSATNVSKTSFIRTMSSSSTTIPVQSPEVINCICLEPRLNDGLFMIACDSCGIWFHGRCVGIHFDISEWRCTRCG